MKNEFQDFNDLQEVIEFHQVKDNSTSIVKGKLHKLFRNCFKILHKRNSSKNLTNYDPRKYDYFVEKLIVKHMPFGSFMVSEIATENKRNICDLETQATFAPQETNDMNSNVLGTHSFSNNIDNSNQSIAPMEIFSLNKFGEVNNSKNETIEKIVTSKRDSANNNKLLDIQETFPIVHVQETSIMEKESKVTPRLLDVKKLNANLNSFLKPQENEKDIYDVKQNLYLNKCKNNDCKNTETFIFQLIQDTVDNYKSYEQTINDSSQSNSPDTSENKAEILFTYFANANLLNTNLKWKITLKYDTS